MNCHCGAMAEGHIGETKAGYFHCRRCGCCFNGEGLRPGHPPCHAWGEPLAGSEDGEAVAAVDGASSGPAAGDAEGDAPDVAEADGDAEGDAEGDADGDADGDASDEAEAEAPADKKSRRRG